MSNGGGDHGRNVHEAARRRMNLRLSQQFSKKTKAARVQASARMFPTLPTVPTVPLPAPPPPRRVAPLKAVTLPGRIRRFLGRAFSRT